MKRTINDWEPETKSLLRTLQAAGAELDGGNNGEDEFRFKTEAKFIEGLTACDEAHLFVNIDGKRRWIFLVYGNEPGVLMSDYSCDPVLDMVCDKHYEEWSGRKQPTKEVEL